MSSGCFARLRRTQHDSRECCIFVLELGLLLIDDYANPFYMLFQWLKSYRFEAFEIEAVGKRQIVQLKSKTCDIEFIANALDCQIDIRVWSGNTFRT